MSWARSRCTIYIMRRTQLYLDDDLWNTLHAHATRTGTTISDLVRTAARSHYMGHVDQRRSDLKAAVGLWSDHSELADSTDYVRNLRKSTRAQRLDLK